MRELLRPGILVGAVLPLPVGLLWWAITPAGLPGSLAGSCIVAGMIVCIIGFGFASGADQAMDRLHPGAAVQRVAAQGLDEETPRPPPLRRWRGTLTILAGAAYIGVGALLWQLR